MNFRGGFNRLLLQRWKITQDAAVRTTWERRHRDGHLTLMIHQHTDRDYRTFGGPYVVEYAVQVEPEIDLIPLGRATWADWDQRGRLVIAQDGRLLHWQPGAGLREIADLNPQAPDPRPAPDWAREPPPAPGERSVG